MTRNTPPDPKQGAEEPNRGSDAFNGLQMPPELMLDLARQAAELVVNRI